VPIVLLLVADLAGLAMLLTTPNDVVAVVVFPVLWIAGSALAASRLEREERAAAVRLFALSYLLRVGLAIVIYHLGVVNVVGDEDSSGWYAGWGYAQSWRGDPEYALIHPDLMQALQRSNQGYYFLAGGWLYALGAPSRVSLAFLSAFAGGLTTVFVYRITLRVFGQDAAQKAGFLAAVFPSLVVWSAQTLKEPFVVLFEVAVIYIALLLRERWSSRHFVMLLGALFGLYTMRFYAAFLCAAAVVLGLAWVGRSRRPQNVLVAGLVMSAAILALFVSGLWQTENQRLNEFNLDWLASFRSNVSTGQPGTGSGIVLPYDVSTPVGMLAAFPLSLLGFLLSPFPWQVVGGSARLKFAMVDVMLWWWLIPKVVVGLREAWRTHRDVVGQVMLFVLPLTVFYTLLFGNGGLAFRERAQILVLMLIFGAAGLVHKRAAVQAESSVRRRRARLSAVEVTR
jgi:4-amino-4-deoxy-L-arabinose transferase-like glycosyltransferase